MTAALLAIGGACGAVARYRMGTAVLKREKHTFPLGTFLINISGALLLGLLCGYGIGGNPYLLFGDGFCGAFTTFSTFSLESVQLIRGRARRKAAAFIALSFGLGIICFLAGFTAAAVLRKI